jgi:hypothetical protein
MNGDVINIGSDIFHSIRALVSSCAAGDVVKLTEAQAQNVAISGIVLFLPLSRLAGTSHASMLIYRRACMERREAVI